jgi:methionyl-tRNA formyltransferase
MEKSALRIIFMGTPEFAVASLKRLLEEGFSVSAVVTAPDKPAGRGMEMQQSAVKTFALSKGLRVLQPTKLKDPEFINELRLINPSLQIVVAFRMLPEAVWNLPPLGTINVHASLLPQYRGAAPINWAIINGEKQTGVTTFKLKHEIDTGDILLSKSITIEEKDNAGSLHDKLKIAGAELLTETLERLCLENLKETPQLDLPPENLHHAPKIHTETCQINWNGKAERIHDLIRGLAPYPAAFTELNGKKLKIFESSYSKIDHEKPPGTMDTDGKTYLRFHSIDGYLDILELQLEGKKRMKTEEFLRGFRP